MRRIFCDFVKKMCFRGSFFEKTIEVSMKFSSDNQLQLFLPMLFLLLQMFSYLHLLNTAPIAHLGCFLEKRNDIFHASFQKPCFLLFFSQFFFLLFSFLHDIVV